MEDAGVNPQSEEYMKAREASRTEARVKPTVDAVEAWKAGTVNTTVGRPMKEGWSDDAVDLQDMSQTWRDDFAKLQKFEDPTFEQRNLKIKKHAFKS